jgi:hypothetical protein
VAPLTFSALHSNRADETTSSAHGMKARAINMRSWISQCKRDSHKASRNGPGRSPPSRARLALLPDQSSRRGERVHSAHILPCPGHLEQGFEPGAHTVDKPSARSCPSLTPTAPNATTRLGTIGCAPRRVQQGPMVWIALILLRPRFSEPCARTPERGGLAPHALRSWAYVWRSLQPNPLAVMALRAITARGFTW